MKTHHLIGKIIQSLGLLAIVAAMSCNVFALEPMLVVATGGRMAPAGYTSGTTTTSFWHRTPHQLGGPVSEIDLGLMNWTDDGKTEGAIQNTTTLSYVWLERASTGQVVPVTFSGARQFVMPANSTAPYFLADPIPSSVWTGSAPAKDEIFWVSIKGSIPLGGNCPLGTPSTYSGAIFDMYAPANDPGTHDFAGPVPIITGATTKVYGLPLLFLGRYTGPGYLAVIGLGDSILDGYGDSQNPVPCIAGQGFLCRAAVDANGKNTIATFNLTRVSEAAVSWNKNNLRQAQILPFANVVVEEFGTNDIGTAGTTPASVVIPTLQTVWATVRSAGVQKIVRTLLMPRTSSINNWSDKANQTPNPGWDSGTIRDTVNAYFDTALTTGTIDLVVDTLSPVADPTDNHYWFSNGTSDYMTSDGTHPKEVGHGLLAVPLRAALLSLTVDSPNPTSAGVTGNGIAIANGDTTPNTANGTDFGTADVTTGSVTNTYMIINSGSATLVLSGAPLVAISGSNAVDFAVVTEPAAFIAVGGSSSFSVKFDPSSAGLRTASVSFANNDPSRDPYVFSIQGTGTGTGVAWFSQDIGKVGITGTTTYSGTTFTVSGEGNEFMTTGTADAFQYAYQSASGDCDIIARVATLSCPGDLAKGEGGVMIRNDLTAGSMCATMGVTTGRGLNFTYRLTTSGSSVNVIGPGGVAPYWVRMTRTGNSFAGYISTTGTSWTQVGTAQTINMGTNVYIGLPATNHSSQLGVATFDNVTATP